jgi:hypothetical protein
MIWPPGKGVTTLPPLGPHPSQLAAYGAYTAAFSNGDPARYTRFYTDDVELLLGSVPPMRASRRSPISTPRCSSACARA